MANHQNRGWRRLAEQSADQWLETEESRALQTAPGPLLQALRQALRTAYLAGYRDRHEAQRRRREES